MLPLTRNTNARLRRLAAVLFVGLTPISLQAADDAALDPDQPYVARRSNPVVYDLDYCVIVTAPYKTKLLRVWMPLPQSDFGQEVTELETTTFPQTVEPQIGTEEQFQNRFAYFEFPSPQGAQIIRRRFQVRVWELRWNVDPAKIVAPVSWPDSFAKYRRNESQAVVIGDRHQTLLAQLLPQRTNAASDLANVMDYVRKEFRYDHGNASLRADSEHLFNTGGGHCSDYHSFCAAVGRAMGYPTRMTYGLNTFPKSSPSHCKLEAYLPPYGWVSFDVSETQKMTQAIAADASLDESAKERYQTAAERRLETGFRDNTWFLQTRGSDYELIPKASRKVPVVRTIYAEADGKPLRDPDPANPAETAYSWMTAQRMTPDHAVPYPFTDLKTLD